MYVDVILPLPLEGLFTYSLPDDFLGKVVAGMRVVVPLGKGKTYYGIVDQVHDKKPSFPTRQVMSLPDDRPVLLDVQLGLLIIICHLWVRYIMQPCLPD